MAKKKDAKKFDIWIRREDFFTARIEADTLEQALEIARSMTIEQLVDSPGEALDSEHKFTGVMEV